MTLNSLEAIMKCFYEMLGSVVEVQEQEQRRHLPTNNVDVRLEVIDKRTSARHVGVILFV